MSLKFQVLILLVCCSGLSFSADCNGVNPEMTRYYYEPLSKSCDKFSLTHKEPSPVTDTNIFNDAVECQKNCFPEPLSKCNLASSYLIVTQDSARRTVFKYERTSNVDKCIPVNPWGTYDEFTENYNAFLVQNDCQVACVRPSECGSPAPKPKDKFYFDDTAKKCLKFSATVDTKLNSNMFDKKKDCKKACEAKPEPRCAPKDNTMKVDANSAQKTVGPGRAGNYFYYDATSTKCLAKAYGGYITPPTDQNIFDSFTTCAKKCPQFRAGVKKLTAPCKVPDTSNPQAAWFDGTSCVPFVMTVKEDPKGNAFASKDACEKACNPQPKPECSPVTDALKVTASSANAQAYTYSMNKNACKGAPYGGYVEYPLGVNVYPTQQACSDACLKEPRCSIPDPKPTPNQFFFDRKTQTCQKVDMNIPLIPVSNVFPDKKSCTDGCLPVAAKRCEPFSSNKKVTKESIRQAYYSYESKRNRCHSHTYGGVVNIPPKANYYSTKLECDTACLVPTTTVVSTSPGETTTMSLAPGETTSALPKYVPPKAYLPDQDPQCCKWAQEGQCDNNPLWMRTMCQVSCGTPGATPETALLLVSTVPVVCLQLPTDDKSMGSKCADKNAKCKEWATQGECLANYEFMLTHCQTACASCGLTIENLYPKCYKGSGGKCINKVPECCYWADIEQNQCHFNPNYMNVICPAACRKCT